MGNTPIWFHCPIARRNQTFQGGYDHNGRRQYRIPPGHTITRTGRTKPRATNRPGHRALDASHEYRCSCGHVGWTTHMDILQRPVVESPGVTGGASDTSGDLGSGEN